MVRGESRAAARSKTGDEISPRLSVDFVNSMACPGCRVGDALDSPRALAVWYRSHLGLPRPPISATSLDLLKDFREDLRTLFEALTTGSRPSPAHLESLNNRLSSVAFRFELAHTPRGWRLRVVPESQDPTSGLIAMLGRSAADLISGPSRGRLRQCRGPSCLHYLLARTRGQLWCSPTGCGNRVRVRRHYRRARRTRPRQR